MPSIVIIGAQWGDEGKGKIVDYLSSKADCVVRFQGGANAGHTLNVGGQKTVLHLVPSGILHPHTECVISAGVVLDVESLDEEISTLKQAGYIKSSKQLLISDAATILMPYHKLLDSARESKAGNDKIGTTGKGIGPAYEDRASRKAILFGDLFDSERLQSKLEKALIEKNFLLEKCYAVEPINAKELTKRLLYLADRLQPFRCRDTSLMIHKALQAEKNVLFEGAQGTMLDLIFGTYPFVTSSSTLAGSACTGTGVGPNAVNQVIGIAKAYTTRVGSGPFPTELSNELGERIQKDGHEFGSTTGRKRRCGWLDLVALKYAVRVNGITGLILTKLDVLTNHEEIAVCTRYQLNDKIIDNLPTSPGDLEHVKPIYQMLPGWNNDLTGIKSFDELPTPAKEYVEFLENFLQISVDAISIGPERDQTIWRRPIFN